LKRAWRYEPAFGVWAAPLAMSTIKEMLYWEKVGETHLITTEKVRRAILELSQWGKVEFDNFAPQLLRVASSLGIAIIETDWHSAFKAARAQKSFY